MLMHKQPKSVELLQDLINLTLPPKGSGCNQENPVCTFSAKYVANTTFFFITEAKVVPYLAGGLVAEWLGCWTHNSRVKGSPPGDDTAWLFLRQVTILDG